MISPLGPNLSSILAQVNTSSIASPLSATGAGDSSSTGGFTDVFKAAVKQVDQLQTGADQQISSVLSAKSTSDVGNVMASVEKADIAFQLIMQVRNKIVSAYQDIEKMQF